MMRKKKGKNKYIKTSQRSWAWGREKEAGSAARFCSHLPSSHGFTLVKLATPFGQALLISNTQKWMTDHTDGKDLFAHPLVFLTEDNCFLLYIAFFSPWV